MPWFTFRWVGLCDVDAYVAVHADNEQDAAALVALPAASNFNPTDDAEIRQAALDPDFVWPSDRPVRLPFRNIDDQRLHNLPTSERILDRLRTMQDASRMAADHLGVSHKPVDEDWRSMQYSASIALPSNMAVECSYCEWHGRFADATDIDSADLNPGHPSPAGRCPVCGALCYTAAD